MPKDSLPIAASHGLSTLRNRGYTLKVIFAVAIIAIAAAIYFWRGQHIAEAQLSLAQAQTGRAEENFTASKGAIDAIVSGLADDLGTPGGVKAEAITALLGHFESTIDALVAKTRNDPELRRSRASMYVQFSAIYLAIGNAKLAVDSAQKGAGIFRTLAGEQPNNNSVQSDVGLSLAKLSEALRASGDNQGALSADRESLDIARALADKDPGNKQFRTDVVLALWRLASVGDNPRERLTEALRLLKNLKLAAMLAPAQEAWIAMIENDLAKQ
jgi:hypothetical protein